MRARDWFIVPQVLMGLNAGSFSASIFLRPALFYDLASLHDQTMIVYIPTQNLALNTASIFEVNAWEQ